ncbi:putative pentatricopeptide repeat-containing protein At3g49142 [Dioscorea cayenensis subsp. rotundata]|uniref:Pentatricopeptide repeat-containing protein At3g49142 n=1 Tax=Dioscorea cayennensis subsp. rotundata TaxID=55577 RepID=A0AB40D1I4_DIOCR|nr:putative pentatricopeptide repeat-containing protein At3g49142 [Dioscorea cayenensis subsp. rotundata]
MYTNNPYERLNKAWLRLMKALPTRLPSHKQVQLLRSPALLHPEHLSDALLLQTLDQCHHPSTLPTLQTLHSHLIDRHLHNNPSIAIKIMRAYASCGHTSPARKVFDGMPHKNIVFYNVMIRSYVNNGLYSNALCLFSEMGPRHGVQPDNYTFPCALKACSASGNLCGGLQIHASVSKFGLDTNLFVGNALITMYARCGRSGHACQVFDLMTDRDVVSWNALIAGYAQNGQFEQALKALKEMMVELNEPRPDSGTMASILPAVLSTDSSNVVFVRNVFDQMVAKGLVSWNAMIAIYANNSMSAEAVELFRRMEMEEGIEPDAITFASVLPACGELSALALGRKIHECIKRKRLLPNMVLENALMDMYANCGCLPAAREVFDNMQGGRDVVSWTCIITAYGVHGYGQTAINLFQQMLDSGLKPDHIAFVSLLSACSYAGLLNEGKHYFGTMTDTYNLVPRIEHFACMVDLLGRGGQLEEAYEFIMQMPLEPNERVWGALLGACRVHSDMSIGLIAADHLFRLVPEQSGYYVLLSNIYARAGRWEDVSSVRKAMTSKGIKKLPGCSNVELGNKVYTFHIGDTSHPQSEEIYKKLNLLLGKMKEMGYAAETDSALHDVEEEDKEGHLSVHSEKLAIAFMLINTGPEVLIRIRMNLRTCGDCHSAAKLISSITKREIILKDSNRFHHFKFGVCSCGDYW